MIDFFDQVQIGASHNPNGRRVQMYTRFIGARPNAPTRRGPSGRYFFMHAHNRDRVAEIILVTTQR